ncbi:unnamed protein product, partial [Adineta ricciae]
MGCTGTKASKAEGDIDRYHVEILNAAQGDDVRRLKEIFDELDKRKATTTKKEVLNMVMLIQFNLPPSEEFPSFSLSSSSSTPYLSPKSFADISPHVATNWTEQVLSQALPLNDYPRPHLRRQTWLNLNGHWLFATTDLNDTFPVQFDRLVRVPFPVESYLSDLDEYVDEHMFLWYKRMFNLPFASQSRILLHFDKVDYETVVYINDKLVGIRHCGGYDPFSYDITSYIHYEDSNEIVVRVWDPSDHWHQARGKQMLDVTERNSIFYTPCSGIWGTVWLEPVPDVYINRVQFQTKISTETVHLNYQVDLFLPSMHSKYAFIEYEDDARELLDVAFEKPSQESMNSDYQLKIHIFKANHEHFHTLTTRQINQNNQFVFSLSDINLWSPEDPYLYHIRIDLYRKTTLIDRVTSYVAFRQISLCMKSKRICLNHKPYFMFGVLDQGYWPDGLYRAPTDEAYKYDIEQMKKLGFNTLRKHMKIETSRWYYWCDVLGMLVWQDMPAGDSYQGYEIEFEQDRQLRLHRDNRTNGLPTKSSMNEDTSARRKKPLYREYPSKIRFEEELQTMIDFLSFHPSIVIWVLFNEEWGQYNTVRLAKWIESYDPNRLVNAASGWQDRENVGHMRDIHDYTRNILLPTINDSNRALVLGECGGFGLTKSGWSYNQYPDEYLLTYAFEQLVVNLSGRLSAMIYTQLSDVENEKNGMLTYNRKRLKLLSEHANRVLKHDFSRLYKLEYVWNLTSIPLTNYTRLSLKPSFHLMLNPNNIMSSMFYFYTCYLYSLVNININNHFQLILNRTHDTLDYYYIPLPLNLFRNNRFNQQYSLGYREADGLTALSIAAGKKHKTLTEILATCPEVDVNKASLSGITPLLMVAEVGWPDILDILLQRGAVVDSAPSGKRAEDNKIAGSTPLIGATKYNHPECVKRLLAHHANPNHQNQSGISALMLAAEQGYFDCVKLLVQAGADLELAPSGQLALTMNLCGQTPLFCAAKEGRIDIVKYLLDRGANPRVQNHYGVSALWIPAQKGMLQVVELLLNAGADTHVAPFGNLADELNITGWTPLYAAMKSRKFDVVKLLLKRGADPNAVTKLGSTPFLLASEICDLDIIEACVEANADLDFAPSGSDADNLNITGQ